MTASSAFVLDGKTIAEGVLARVAEGARRLEARGVKPGLAVVLVGDDPASQAYVASKGRAALGLRLPFGAAHAAGRRPPRPSCWR